MDLRRKGLGASEDISVIVPPCRAEYSLIRLKTCHQIKTDLRGCPFENEMACTSAVSGVRNTYFQPAPAHKPADTGANFRSGSFSEVAPRDRNVRATLRSRHPRAIAAGPKSADFRTHAPHKTGSCPITSSAQAARAHSGNPAFRSPSIISFAFDCPPRAIHADIVKAGSSSSRRAAASRASASRPRWAKADARQR